eukprot:1158782-Pelagomonas_calceolata.AAC.6
MDLTAQWHNGMDYDRQCYCRKNPTTPHINGLRRAWALKAGLKKRGHVSPSRHGSCCSCAKLGFQVSHENKGRLAVANGGFAATEGVRGGKWELYCGLGASL